jgi:hypothetical protein
MHHNRRRSHMTTHTGTPKSMASKGRKAAVREKVQKVRDQIKSMDELCENILAGLDRDEEDVDEG